MTDWSPTKTTSGRPPLQRSADAKIAGVSGGVGGFLGIDKNIIRVLFVVLAALGGAGFLAYLGAWILMPPPGATGPASSQPERSNVSLVVGGGLLAIAVLLALVTAGGADPIGFVILGLLFAGVVILNRRPKGTALPTTSAVAMPSPPPPPPAPPAAPTAPMPPVFDPPPTDLAVDEPTEVLETTELPDTTDLFETADFLETDELTDGRDLLAEARAELDRELPDPTSELSIAPPAPPLFDPPVPPPPPRFAAPPPPPLQEAPPRSETAQREHWAVTKTADETSLTAAESRRQAGPPLASISLAALVALLGVVLVFNTLAGTFVGAVATTGIGTAIVGVMMAISAFTGRTLPLVPLAILMVAGLAASPTIDHAIEDGTGSSEVRVATLDELQSSYRMGVGELYLDLSELDFAKDTIVEVEVGTGALEVILPPDAIVEVHAESTVGYVEALGEGRGGIGTELNVSPSAAADPDAPRLILEAKTTIGSLEIYRNRRPGG